MSPARKQQQPKSFSETDVEEMETNWYTAGEAAKKLTENSGRPVDPSYVSKLGQLSKIRMKKVHARLVLYSKTDIDNYVVEARGTKSGKAAQDRSKKS